MATPLIKPSGNIAIIWGTVNAANAGANVMPTGLILESLSITPKNGDPIDIEGGAGFTAIQVGIKDGFSAKATGVYDSNKAMPAEGDAVTLIGPKQDGANAGNANYNCTFWSWGLTKARKKETMVELNFTYRPDINGAPS
jgi:hypothetical protein